MARLGIVQIRYVWHVCMNWKEYDFLIITEAVLGYLCLDVLFLQLVLVRGVLGMCPQYIRHGVMKRWEEHGRPDLVVEELTAVEFV